jgi:Uma2 family endonuclease
MWDEMWEGVLHMAPSPNRAHQDLGGAMETYLRLRWARPHGNRVYHDINLASPGGWPNNYRIPDLLLLTPARFSIDRNEYFEGAPDVVVEIRSPSDESYEKLEFYAQLGVPEVWIIERDSKAPEIYVLQAGGYVQKAAGAEGWVLSDVTGIELRIGHPGKLAMRFAGNDSTREDLPED